VTLIKYRRDIDGLRAVAVLLVIIFHGFPGAIPGGFIGVDIFFVISGYLITGIILRELELGTFSIANFYVRRVRRIFPALLTILLFTVTLGWFFFLPNELISLGKNVYAGALFGPNLMLLSEVGYFDTAAQLKPLLHLWSLGIEEQFYAAFPLFLIFLSSRKYNLLGGIAGLAIISFLLNVMFVKTNSAATFYLPFTRAWELMIGAILALPKLRWALRDRYAFDADIRAAVGAILIGIGAVALDSKMSYPGWAALLPVLGTALLIAAQAAFLNSVVLSTQVLVFVGLISYPLYLWHWPLLSFFEVLSDEPATPIFRVAVLIVSVVLAYLTYRFIELPLRTDGSRLLKAASLSAAMGLVCMFGAIVVNGAGFPSRLTAAIGNAGILKPTFGGLQKSSCMLDSNTQTMFPDDCLEAGTAPLLLLWGDSTAGALAPGFRQLPERTKS
jgi:peptidoglycan/LPS O-acetylase OafA/YrhL